MQVKKAVVLAAGRGKRMGELTEDLPKPMLPIDGKPMLQYVLEHLSKAGVEQVALVVGYRRDAIIEHFRDFPLAITFLTQEVPNGTASAAALAREFAGADPFVLTFGDILCAPSEYTGMADRMLPDIDGVIGVKWVDDPWRGAAVYTDEHRILTRIVEKPAPGSSTTNWNSAGLYLFRDTVFPELAAVPLSPRGEYELTSAVQALIAKGRRLALHDVRSDWRDVGTPEDLSAIQKQQRPR